MKELPDKDMPLKRLREVVQLSKKRRLVAVLAEAQELTRQAIYSWLGETSRGQPVLTGEAAYMRLLRIARLKDPRLKEISAAAGDAIEALEAGPNEQPHAE